MRSGSAQLLAVFLLSLFLGTACKRGAEGPDLSNLGPSSAATTTVLPVGSEHCPGGGIGIYTGKDANNNGILEALEFQKGAPVCSPTTDDGKPSGNPPLVMVVSEPSSTVRCLAGGLKVLSGTDTNRNNVLDATEVSFTEFLCNGTPGSSAAASIALAGPAPQQPEDKKKGKKPAPAKKQQAAAKPAAKAPAKKETTEALAAPAAKEQTGDPAAAPKKAKEKAKPAPVDKPRSASAKPSAPPAGWTSVKVNAPQLAQVSYKVEGKSVTVRFTNLSKSSSVRFKYTVRWKINQNGTWVADSSMEGISFRLKPEESLDREVRMSAQDARDVSVELDVAETS